MVCPGTVASMPLPIEDYAVVGDTGTAALIGRDGSVDWLCLPRFDSPACFAALLGDEQNGRWLIGPADEAETSRRYVGHTAVLETTYTTDTGTVRVLDVMPIGDRRADLVRRVTGVEGTVRMRHEWVVRFGYGRIRPWVHRADNHGTEVITAVAGPDRIILRADRLPHSVDHVHADEFDVHAGEELQFTCTWVPSHHPMPEPLALEGRLEDTADAYEDWADRCSYAGPHREAVLRSLLTLRLLTHGGTGGIVAAPTTSLPEDFGGERNWDYRFCWLRDAALTLEAFLASGYEHEARLWRDWLLRAVAGRPRRPAGDVRRRRRPRAPRARARPPRRLRRVPPGPGRQRRGRPAADRRARRGDGRARGGPRDRPRRGRRLVGPAARPGRRAGRDLGGARPRPVGDPRSAAAFHPLPGDGVGGLRPGGPGGREARPARTRSTAGAPCATRSARRSWRRATTPSATPSPSTTTPTAVDASLLVLPTVGFVEGDDPRMLGTIAAVEEDLMEHGFLLRYRTETGVDGLRGDEHPFLACSFWLVSAYALAGRVDDARALMERLLTVPNDVGLLPEEYDPVEKRFVGNFPQAFSHLTLVGAAIQLERAATASQR